MARLDSFLRLVVAQSASDLHIHTGAVPFVRHHGQLIPLQFRKISENEGRRFIGEVLSPHQRQALEEKRELDFIYEISGLARFRANAFYHNDGLGAVFRVIPARPQTFEELCLPATLKELVVATHGLVIVTGPTGAGKSTTVASMVHEINRTSRRHIITVEDPIEFIHEPLEGVVTQRAVGKHTESFADALRAAQREAPDVVLVGEIRDHETVSLALSAAESGMLVLATLHTMSAAKAVSRMIDVLPSDRRTQGLGALSVLLRGVVAQHLCRRRDGGGRIPAVEVLIQSYAVAHMIRSNKLHLLDGFLQSISQDETATRSLESSLAGHVRHGLISADEAFGAANHPQHLRSLLERGEKASGDG